jgi:hypothetical protein
VLHRNPNAFVLSTVVTTGAAGEPRKHFTNLRVFVEEAGAWKCRIWVNRPRPADDGGGAGPPAL